MKKNKWMALIALGAALMAAPFSALGETGRVVTPGGPVNMRKRAEDKAPIVESVQNRSLVEIEEMGDTWSRIVYKKKTGWVKTEFLKAPSQLVGSAAYPDGGAVFLRSAPAADAPIIGVLSCAQRADILGLEGDFLAVQAGGREGYTEAVNFSYQLDAPAAEIAWITENAQAAEDCALRAEANQKSAETGKLSKGQPVQATVIEGKFAFVIAEDQSGWAPLSALCLIGAPDTEDTADGMPPSQAGQIAAEALTKKFKAFAKERLYNTFAVYEEKDGLPGPLYHVGYFNDQDQYLYGALVSAETGSAVFCAHYDGFAAPEKESAPLLPSGEIKITLSAQEMAVGDVLDITVEAWTRHQIVYQLYAGSRLEAESKPGSHFTAAYRPRKAGEYTLTVTVTDENKQTAVESQSFTVVSEYVVADGEEKGADGYPVYSQKDGWWKDKTYRHSNLGKSGCAIFALSHALARMGKTGSETLPENLAVKYSYCLIPEEGTNNTLLINTAARDFGFTTQGELIKDQDKIKSLLQGGTLFSFSIARGHIAMVSGISEDGTMACVVDSAPGATYERIPSDTAQYYRMHSGAFRAALTLDDLPGIRWYFETDEYGGLEYWMPMEYIARRGVRLIQPLGAEGQK